MSDEQKAKALAHYRALADMAQFMRFNQAEALILSAGHLELSVNYQPIAGARTWTLYSVTVFPTARCYEPIAFIAEKSA